MLVANLAPKEAQSAGLHQLKWDGKNERGSTLPFGTYFCQLQIGNEWITEKLVYLAE